MAGAPFTFDKVNSHNEPAKTKWSNCQKCNQCFFITKNYPENMGWLRFVGASECNGTINKREHNNAEKIRTRHFLYCQSIKGTLERACKNRLMHSQWEKGGPTRR